MLYPAATIYLYRSMRDWQARGNTNEHLLLTFAALMFDSTIITEY